MRSRRIRRWCGRYREEGETGLADRRLGKASAKRVPDADAEEIERLYRERYQGFSAKHFHEHLVADHGFHWGYTWTKTFLHGRGLLRPATIARLLAEHTSGRKNHAMRLWVLLILERWFARYEPDFVL